MPEPYRTSLKPMPKQQRQQPQVAKTYKGQVTQSAYEARQLMKAFKREGAK